MKRLFVILLGCLLLWGCSGKGMEKDLAPTGSPETQVDPLPETLPPQDTTNTTEEGAEITEATSELTEATSPDTEETVMYTTATEEVTEPELRENSAWAEFSQYEDAFGIVLNEPVENPPAYTDLWIEGEYECAYIIPRYTDTYVNLYEVEWSEDFSEYTLVGEPVYSTLSQDGTVIYSVLHRPEGFPSSYLEMVAPDGSKAGFILEYDGRDGTAPIEFFKVVQ